MHKGELLGEALFLGQRYPDGDFGGSNFQDEWLACVRVCEDGHVTGSVIGIPLRL